MKLKKQLLIAACACLPAFAHADDPANTTYSWAYNTPTPPPGGGGGGGSHHGGHNTPLDGGLSILAAAGIGYGIKRYAAKKKKQNREPKEDIL